MTNDQQREDRIATLRKARPRSLYSRLSSVAMIGLAVWAWLSAGKLTGRLPFERRWQNFQRFVSELTPSPVRKSDGDWSEAGPWAWELLVEKGLPALGNTVAIACAAIIISAAVVIPFLPLASRRLARRDPFGIFSGNRGTECLSVRDASAGADRRKDIPPHHSETNPKGGKLARQRSEDSRAPAPQDSPINKQGIENEATLSVREGKTIQQGKFAERTGVDRWNLIGRATRFLFVLARAVPEYILAFLLISLLGLTFWPLVLALAIHNFGILGRLWGEVVENANDSAASHAISSGLTRKQTFLTTIFPDVFNRFLIYFFYRWETCVKDATVLGMLGVLTLGHLIMLAKGFFWDRMLFFVLLGAAVIMVGDFLSTWIRRSLRG